MPAVNAHEQSLQQLSDDQLRQKTRDWQQELQAIEDNKVLAGLLEEIMPEAFAVVKDACRRLCGSTIQVRGHELEWNMIPFDVQLVGGMAMHLSLIHI